MSLLRSVPTLWRWCVQNLVERPVQIFSDVCVAVVKCVLCGQFGHEYSKFSSN